MIDDPRNELPHEALAAENNIATAPGDLPIAEINARFAALRWQFRHDNTISPLQPQPGQPVEVFATSGADLRLQAASVYYTTDGSPPDARSERMSMALRSVEWDPRSGYVSCWKGEIPGQQSGTVVRYRIGAQYLPDRQSEPDLWAHDGQGLWFRFPGERGITTFAYTIEACGQPLPDWMNEAVIYHIFLDRFHPGTPDGTFTRDGGAMSRHGGTLGGVQQALPYLAELGVTCLWFSPLGPSETYHRYDTTDYFNVDPELGTSDDLHHLVQQAHDLGIRIWLDFVPSHSSWKHPAFQAAQRDPTSPTYSWYTFNHWPSDYRSFLQASPQLPSFNTDDPGARGHLLDAAVHWLETFDVDGFRLDHVIAAGMDFWTALRRATQAVKEDAVLVGEATDTPDCLRRYRGHLHGILDFPLARALRHTFATGDWSVEQLDAFLQAYEIYMADGPGTVSFLDNHDMDRFLWVAGNDIGRLKLAAICQFTLRATPVLYYGTEIGMTQQYGAAEVGFGGDSQARGDMVWEQAGWDHDLLSFYRSLIRLRRDEKALHGGVRSTVQVDTREQTYAYVCAPEVGGDHGNRLLVAFSLGARPARLHLTLHERVDTAESLLSTGATPVLDAEQSQLHVALEPRSAAIIRLS